MYRISPFEKKGRKLKAKTTVGENIWRLKPT